jgi:hypothetical protein
MSIEAAAQGVPDARMRFPDAVLAERVAFLFTRYQALTLLLPAQPAKPRRRKAKVTA